MAETPATKFLKEHSIEFEAYEYKYQVKGEARQAEESIGVELHKMLKTLVFEADNLDPFLLILFGDRKFPKRNLPIILEQKKYLPATAKQLPIGLDINLVGLPLSEHEEE